jgi:hypothetical protein
LKQIRKIIQPGKTRSLWKAVKVAKDVGTSTLPSTMFERSIKIKESTLTDRFADFFDTKIKNLHNEVERDDSVYNGRKLITTTDKFFMEFWL